MLPAPDLSGCEKWLPELDEARCWSDAAYTMTDVVKLLPRRRHDLVLRRRFSMRDALAETCFTTGQSSRMPDGFKIKAYHCTEAAATAATARRAQALSILVTRTCTALGSCARFSEPFGVRHGCFCVHRCKACKVWRAAARRSIAARSADSSDFV